MGYPIEDVVLFQLAQSQEVGPFIVMLN